jgi:hypothetical protein
MRLLVRGDLESIEANATSGAHTRATLVLI